MTHPQVTEPDLTELIRPVRYWPRRFARKDRECGGARTDQGFVSLLAAVLMTSLVLSAGLAYDGGRVFAAKVEALDEAGQAARAGAQALSPDLRGDTAVAVDPALAQQAVNRYLSVSGHKGSIEVTGSTVRVTVRFQRNLSVLGLAGIGPAEVSETASATAEAGIVKAGA